MSVVLRIRVSTVLVVLLKVNVIEERKSGQLTFNDVEACGRGNFGF